MRKLAIVAALAAISLTTAACDEGPPKPVTAKQNEANKNQVAADSIVFTENAERDNIVKRIKLTSNPGQIGYVALTNMAGRPIAYYGVQGKITSSGKRLTAPWQGVRADCGEFSCDGFVDAPSDDGTWGSSDAYIYFWTTDGQYVQWSGEYIYSDQPFRLAEKPLISQ